MWGAMVYRAGVGPEPCTIDKLTVDILANKLSELKNDRIRERAVELSKSMKSENGVKGGLEHFLDGLPRDNMLCDVSLLLGETKIACYRIVNTDIKISLEVAASLRDQPLREPRTGVEFLVNTLKSLNVLLNWLNPSRPTRYRKHAMCTYALGRVHTFSQGVAAGWFGLLREIFRGLFETYTRPDKFARSHGAFGCLFGLALAPFYILFDVFRGFVVFIDRILVGISNGWFNADKLFIIDTMVRAHVYETTAEKHDLLNHDIPSDSRREQIRYALRLANSASHIFFSCKPIFPPEHWHWLEADLKLLKENITRQGKSRLSLNTSENEVILGCLDACPFEKISFSRFCLYLNFALKSRMERWNRPPYKNNAKETTSHLTYVTGTPGGVTDEEEEQNSKISILSRLMSPRAQPAKSRMNLVDNNIDDSSNGGNGNSHFTTASNDKRRSRRRFKRSLSV
jgi:hypothetical protein